MSPKTADPAIRTALVEAAARLIAEHEPLTTRRLAAEVGTSTMAVYTHFGAIDEVRRAVRRDGFGRLADHLALAGETDDPVADVAALGWGYCVNALKNPNLYRVMFMESALDDEDATVGLDTFETLIRGVQRCIDAGRFEIDDATEAATQMWIMVHGTVALYLAGMLDAEQAMRLPVAMGRAMFIAFGDDTEATDRSLGETARRVAALGWEGPPPS